jgi:integrase
LLKLGIVEYAKARKLAGEVYLLPNVERGVRGRGMGAKISIWWPRWTKNYKGITKRAVFHSLRHGFTQALIAAEVPEVVVKQLVGHHDASMTTGTYGRRLDVRQLAAAVAILDYSNEVHALRDLVGDSGT